MGNLIGKAVDNVRLDAALLACGLLSAREKAGLLASKYRALLRRDHAADFLGRRFVYDNVWLPAFFGSYCRHAEFLHRHLHLDACRTVVDIGANVGQFAWPLLRLFPQLTVRSYEPNPAAFALLERNAAGHPRWQVYPRGVSEREGTRTLYYVAGKSAQGSLYEALAREGLAGSAQAATVTLEPLDLPDPVVDLLKIDVEGHEAAVVRGCARVRPRWVYVEVTLSQQSLPELLALCERTWGVIAEQAILDASSSRQDLLLRFAP